MKKYIYLGIAAVLFLMSLALVISFDKIGKQKAEISRKTQNIEVLSGEITTSKTKSEQLMSKIGALTYTVGEYERLKAKDAETIADMKIRLKNVSNSTRIQTVTETKFVDKLITQPDSTICFDYSDKFNAFSGCLNKDSIFGKFSNREELFLVVHTKRTKKFLFWEYGRKITEISAKSENPETRISKIDYIVVKD